MANVIGPFNRLNGRAGKTEDRTTANVSFADRLAPQQPLAGQDLSSPGLGQRAVSAAVGSSPSALAYAASTLNASATRLNEEGANLVERVDQARIYALQNAIFEAGNAPIVERDL